MNYGALVVVCSVCSEASQACRSSKAPASRNAPLEARGEGEGMLTQTHSLVAVRGIPPEFDEGAFAGNSRWLKKGQWRANAS